MSLWEAQMLHAKGRLSLDRPFETWLREASAPGVVALLALDVSVVVALDHLPQSFHGDPADRLIVATALTHGLLLATHDRAILASGPHTSTARSCGISSQPRRAPLRW